SRATAVAELHAINRRVFPLWKASYQDDRATWGLVDLKSFVVGDVGAIAGVALAASGLVWLIACVNASNLLIARVAARRRELAVPAALGASRGRVMRHLLAESALLAAGAAILGGVAARAGVGVLRDLGGGYLPRTQEIALDGTALAVLAALTAMSTALFGAVPALHVSGGPLRHSRPGARRSSPASAAAPP